MTKDIKEPIFAALLGSEQYIVVTSTAEPTSRELYDLVDMLKVLADRLYAEEKNE